MISTYSQKQLFAPFTVEGSAKSKAFLVVRQRDGLPQMRLHRNVFETWLVKCFVLALKPGQVVIMDNATFHKGG